MTTPVLSGIRRPLQQGASRALVELLDADLAELNRYLPKEGPDAGTLLGVHDDGDVHRRVNAVDDWARHLGVTPAWEQNGAGGEYYAAAQYQGVRVHVGVWLPEAPMAVDA
ncbi:hypothetical protein [Streptosporangium amethystogenes]|uniref:hypothetical protein n=1 Tax=Streptosporangium amethystogenes TaxID=2002 RepID=UPI0004C63E6B|nr:hypothetical protein [Streptosporangium amethystogenes]